ncbi:hypothetical protein NDU88_002136 [Pleurodeles waltl]|uniref:Uncharacterized protein n=1 Tax=Pleurodeles waltl TaxID=8319 RepID=A0AAV7RA22_PLEWA|nr:hypothetical protein NDU88_002136 [Pleurodeles waltl]
MGQLQGGASLLPAALQGELCLQAGTDMEHRLRCRNQAATGGPRQQREAPPSATAPQDEEGGRRWLQSVHLPAPQQTPARSSWKPEHRGEWRDEAPRLWGTAQQRLFTLIANVEGVWGGRIGER